MPDPVQHSRGGRGGVNPAWLPGPLLLGEKTQDQSPGAAVLYFKYLDGRMGGSEEGMVLGKSPQTPTVLSPKWQENCCN